MSTSKLWSAFALAGLLSTIGLGAQQPAPAAQAINLQEAVPFDAAVRTGTLPNGLRFFIRQNPRPAMRLSLRLAVKAGSLYETEDQQGLAHFLEHMAFNGSAHFKPGELVSYFERTGARLGPHVNAYTSFDETVYMLELPTDSTEIVSNGLNALADFAGGLTLDPEQVDKERGVVIEEWRGRLGAGSRIGDKQLPILYYQSRYADRLPIGKPEILRSAPASRLRSFYDTWYRPDQMAIVAVGDVDPQKLEAAIRAAFEPIMTRAAASSPPDRSVPLHKDLLVNIASDPEVTQSTVQLIWKRPAEEHRVVADYRRDLVEQLFDQMLNERFTELERRPDAKFLSAGAGGESLSRSVETFAVNARVPDGGLAEGLGALVIEAKRAREYGFSPAELDRAKRWIIASYERAFNERGKEESGSFAQEYVRYFLSEEPAPGIEYEHRLVQAVLPGITLDEVTAMARARLSGASRIVLAVSPQKQEIKLPSESDLVAALGSAENVAVMPWNDRAAPTELMADKPAPAAITERREIADMGVTIVRFANGVEAWLKPTDFKNDQVLFTMYALGGASLAAPADFVEASLATSYVELSGLGGLKTLDLDKLLAGKLASASPFISLSTHGLSGSAAPADLETALQLLHQVAVKPGDDPDAFVLMKRQFTARLANRGQSPGQIFGERIAQVNTSNHYTSRPLTTERVAALDRAKMLAFYRDRFANAADFTFFMVGAFRLDTAIPLLAQYVGSLPSTSKRTAEYKDLQVRFPAGIERVRVEKGREPRSQTVISFFADPSPDAGEQERITAATTVLSTALRDVLREELGQTYTVSVGLSQSWPQRGGGHIRVSFGAAPENIQSMTERVLQEIRRLQQEGPSADLTARAKESARRGYETSMKQNAYWLGRLQTVHMMSGDPHEILTRSERIDAVTPALLQEIFKKYFPLDRYTAVTLMPEVAGQ
jgi:zinc protease